MTMFKISEEQKEALLERLRVVVVSELDAVVRVRKTFTPSEITKRSGVDIKHLAKMRVNFPEDGSFEFTLRQLIAADFLNVDILLDGMNNLKSEEQEYVSKFRVYEDKTITDKLEFIASKGINVGLALSYIIEMANIVLWSNNNKTRKR